MKLPVRRETVQPIVSGDPLRQEINGRDRRAHPYINKKRKWGKMYDPKDDLKKRRALYFEQEERFLKTTGTLLFIGLISLIIMVLGAKYTSCVFVLMPVIAASGAIGFVNLLIFFDDMPWK